MNLSLLLWIISLAFAQNIAFSIVSRARNRNNFYYHLIASVCSNGIWFATFRLLVLADMTWHLFIPYTVGTVVGSLTGAQISMWIEHMLGANADAGTPDKIKLLENRIITLERALNTIKYRHA